ncbi:MAG: ABC transporter substrate-binding protein [Actinomycetota bacterium]
MSRYRLLAIALGIVMVMTTITACSNEDSSDTTTAGSDSGSAVVDEAAVALLPDEIKEAGVLEIGTELSYSPDEYKDPDGNPTGWGIELVTALSYRLGLEPNFHESQFDNIIPSVKGRTFDIGWASFTDTFSRQESVDFVDYFVAGSQWAAQAGSGVDPEDACGLTVAVGTGTWQETNEVPAISDACVADGKEPIHILKLDGHEVVTNAVVLGRADAFVADSPVTQYAVSLTEGKLELAGDIVDSAPFGIAVAKDAGTLKDALATAMQSMIDDGTYLEILTKWGVEEGAIEEVTINGAVY